LESFRYTHFVGWLSLFSVITAILKSLNFAKTGHGGFGHVVLCENKLDGRQYAVKKIRLKDKSLPVNDRILR
jgi:serine/threonine protein kinase